MPTARVPDLHRPDRLVFDLDPPPGAFALVRRAAYLIRDALGELGLATVPVATGSKGYHVIAAIRPSATVEALAHAVQKVSALLVEKHPLAASGNRPDSLAALAATPSDVEPFIAAVDVAFESSGLVLETFDRFRS